MGFVDLINPKLSLEGWRWLESDAIDTSRGRMSVRGLRETRIGSQTCRTDLSFDGRTLTTPCRLPLSPSTRFPSSHVDLAILHPGKTPETHKNSCKAHETVLYLNDNPWTAVWRFLFAVLPEMQDRHRRGEKRVDAREWIKADGHSAGNNLGLGSSCTALKACLTRLPPPCTLPLSHTYSHRQVHQLRGEGANRGESGAKEV